MSDCAFVCAWQPGVFAVMAASGGLAGLSRQHGVKVGSGLALSMEEVALAVGELIPPQKRKKRTAFRFLLFCFTVFAFNNYAPVDGLCLETPTVNGAREGKGEGAAF